MCAHVSLEMVHEGVAFSTVGTTVRPQTTVDTLVRLQAALLCESFATGAAGIWTLACVCAQVNGQV